MKRSEAASRNARQDIEFEDIYDIAKEVSLEGSELVMTIAEQLINEGLQKGLERGIQKGLGKGILTAKLETAIQLLTKKFGTLPEKLQNRIQKADADTLSLILENIFDLANLEDVDRCFVK